MKHMTYLLMLALMIFTSLSASATTYGDDEEGGEEEVARMF
jgi:hypothetical protein